MLSKISSFKTILNTNDSCIGLSYLGRFEYDCNNTRHNSQCAYIVSEPLSLDEL